MFEFSDRDIDGPEKTGVINVRVVQSVATAVPITLTITPTEYSDEFGFDVPVFNPNSPNIATRTYVCFLPLYYVRCLLRHLAHCTYDHQLPMLVTINYQRYVHAEEALLIIAYNHSYSWCGLHH